MYIMEISEIIDESELLIQKICSEFNDENDQYDETEDEYDNSEEHTYDDGIKDSNHDDEYDDLSDELFSSPSLCFRICSSSSASLPTSRRSLIFSLLFRKRNLTNRIIKTTGTPKKMRIISNSIGPGVQKAKILFIIFYSFLYFLWVDLFRFQPGIDVGPVEFDIFAAYPHIRRAVAAGDIFINCTLRITQISR